MKTMYFAVFWALLAVTMLAAGSCGKKGPPEPPEQKDLPVARNLDVELHDSNLVLEWTLPENLDKDAIKPAGFIVYRSKTSIGGECPDCPDRYERVGWVAYRSGRFVPETWSFEDTAGPGYVYKYRVRCYSEKGSLGNPSETVTYKISEDSGEDGSGG
ncbi:MAG: hypothetical protein R6X08_06325 [Desulfosalsimonadaceae bacterium]